MNTVMNNFVETNVKWANNDKFICGFLDDFLKNRFPLKPLNLMFLVQKVNTGK